MIASQIIELERVDSTNAWANRAYSSTEFEDGTVIRAHDQYAGRGQQDNSWSSEAGKNLTFTVCLRPAFLPPGRQFQLNKAIALGVLDFIRSFPHPCLSGKQATSFIKWPNDVWVDNLKIAGILIENKIMGAKFEASFTGIGVNINQNRFSTDLPNPVSLIHYLGYETDLKEALLSLCSFLDIRYTELRKARPAEIDRAYNLHLLGFNRWRFFTLDGNLMEGRIIGVDEIGRLQLETRDGKVLFFSHREIEYAI